MSTETGGDAFTVLINEEGQYSLWPGNKAVPDGWSKAGFDGDRESCMAWVDEHWTDMRPASLRKVMDA